MQTALKPLENRQKLTQFKPKHNKAELRTAYAVHASEGRTNGEFAEIHGMSLRMLQNYIADWKLGEQPAQPIQPQPNHFTGEQEQVSPLSASDVEQAKKVWRMSMRGEPVTPTRARIAEATLKAAGYFDGGNIDERSEFQSYPDEALAKLLVELAPTGRHGEARITPLIQHQDLTPQQMVVTSSGPEPAQAHGQPPQQPAQPPPMDAVQALVDELPESSEGQRLF